MKQSAEASPRLKARVAGAFYFLTFATGGVAALTSGKLVVFDDAVATATNIHEHESLFQLGSAAYLVDVACYVVVPVLFYDLFKPVNGSLSLIAACFSLLGCAVQASACALHSAASAVLNNAQYSSLFKPVEVQSLALLFLKLHAQAFNIGVAFFGFYCVLIGCLVLKSTFLPRVLGVLMIVGGLGWLTFLSPPLASSLSPYVLAPGILGEASLTLWLLVMGVNVPKWREAAIASRALEA